MSGKKDFGVICKIWFGKESWVFSEHDVVPEGERDYLDLMRTGDWPNVMGHNGLWIWGTPRNYMKGRRTKLLLYDKFQKAITVIANVIPREMEEKHEGCKDSEYCFPFRNVMDESTIDILENPIELEVIRNIPGNPSFKNFGIHRKDRSPYRVISQEQFDFLINASKEVEK
ncbi:hypothetical protein ACNF40_02905 [Cuniculiplasma sp. SKW4]|uniref:hypothetical protein n=1 Tax=Cuniculiplasma sp. SKW4 TaxID=3400171 RepID=UPI003FD4E5FB